MFKLGCLLMLVILIGVPVLASQYLPWWGTCLVILAEGALFVIAGPKLIAWGIKRFAIGLFRTKSQVLEGASVQIHDVQPTEKPMDETESAPAEESNGDDEAEDEEPDQEEEDEDEEGPIDLRYVLIDFTVTPADGASKMAHWEPSELMLVPFDLANDTKEDDDVSATVARIRMIDSTGQETDDFDKITGPGRFRAIFGCPPKLTGRVKLRYYFEGLGDLRLP